MNLSTWLRLKRRQICGIKTPLHVISNEIPDAIAICKECATPNRYKKPYNFRYCADPCYCLEYCGYCEKDTHQKLT